MHITLAILFVSYVTFMYFGGFFGFIKAKPFRFSDKVDLFYIEPRHARTLYQDADSPRRNVRVGPTKQLVARRTIPNRVLPVRTALQLPRQSPRKQPVDARPAHSIEPAIFRDCVSALHSLGYGSNSACERVVKNHCAKSGPIHSCEEFLQSIFIKGPDESKLRSTS